MPTGGRINKNHIQSKPTSAETKRNTVNSLSCESPTKKVTDSLQLSTLKEKNISNKVQSQIIDDEVFIKSEINVKDVNNAYVHLEDIMLNENCLSKYFTEEKSNLEVAEKVTKDKENDVIPSFDFESDLIDRVKRGRRAPKINYSLQLQQTASPRKNVEETVAAKSRLFVVEKQLETIEAMEEENVCEPKRMDTPKKNLNDMDIFNRISRTPKKHNKLIDKEVSSPRKIPKKKNEENSLFKIEVDAISDKSQKKTTVQKSPQKTFEKDISEKTVEELMEKMPEIFSERIFQRSLDKILEEFDRKSAQNSPSKIHEKPSYIISQKTVEKLTEKISSISSEAMVSEKIEEKDSRKVSGRKRSSENVIEDTNNEFLTKIPEIFSERIFQKSIEKFFKAAEQKSGQTVTNNNVQMSQIPQKNIEKKKSPQKTFEKSHLKISDSIDKRSLKVDESLEDCPLKFSDIIAETTTPKSATKKSVCTHPKPIDKIHSKKAVDENSLKVSNVISKKSPEKSSTKKAVNKLPSKCSDFIPKTSDETNSPTKSEEVSDYYQNSIDQNSVKSVEKKSIDYSPQKSDYSPQNSKDNRSIFSRKSIDRSPEKSTEESSKYYPRKSIDKDSNLGRKSIDHSPQKSDDSPKKSIDNTNLSRKSMNESSRYSSQRSADGSSNFSRKPIDESSKYSPQRSDDSPGKSIDTNTDKSFRAPRSGLFPAPLTAAEALLIRKSLSTPPMIKDRLSTPLSSVPSASCLRSSANRKRPRMRLDGADGVDEPFTKAPRLLDDDDGGDNDQSLSSLSRRRQSVTFSNMVEVKEIRGTSFEEGSPPASPPRPSPLSDLILDRRRRQRTNQRGAPIGGLGAVRGSIVPVDGIQGDPGGHGEGDQASSPSSRDKCTFL